MVKKKARKKQEKGVERKEQKRTGPQNKGTEGGRHFLSQPITQSVPRTEGKGEQSQEGLL